ncbi:MAG: O-antigen ligase family protein [Clostridia bacterium]|nr:O-antigen ligase family protein [Clostridia bacterium]
MSGSKKKKSAGGSKKSASTASATVKRSVNASDLPGRKVTTVPASPLFDRDNLMEIFARLFVIAMSVVFPLSIGAEKYANITHFKNMSYYLIAAAAFCAIIITLIVKVIKMPPDAMPLSGKRPDFNAVDIAVLCYWGFLLISTLLSPYKDVAFNGQGVRNDGFIIQTFYVATYFVISRLLRLRIFDLNIYCLGGAAVSMLVMLHFFGFDVLDTGFSQPNWESGLLFMGPMGNINLTSYFVSVTLMMTAALYVTERQLPFDRDSYLVLSCFAIMLWAEMNLNTDAGLVAIGVGLLAALPLLLTDGARVGRFLHILSVALTVLIFNRLVIGADILGKDFGKTGWLMVLANLAVGVAMLIHKRNPSWNPSRKALLIATLSVDGAVILGVLIAAGVAASHETKGILYEFGQILFHGNMSDRFGHNRGFTWKRALKLVGSHPIFGSGPDSFCNVFMETYGDEATKFFKGRTLDKAHNEYLQLLICSGITGLGAFVAFLGLMVKEACQRMEKNPLLVCCAIGVVTYAVHAFFGYSLPINSPLMWTLFGLTGAAVRVKDAA